jgi:hypothetical protein
MHGLIHLELQKFVEERFGAKAWAELIRRTGLASEIYTPLRSYPDEQMLALVGEAVTMTGFTWPHSQRSAHSARACRTKT